MRTGEVHKTENMFCLMYVTESVINRSIVAQSLDGQFNKERTIQQSDKNEIQIILDQPCYNTHTMFPGLYSCT